MVLLVQIKLLYSSITWRQTYTLSYQKTAAVTHLFMPLTPFDYIDTDIKIAQLFYTFQESI